MLHDFAGVMLVLFAMFLHLDSTSNKRRLEAVVMRFLISIAEAAARDQRAVKV
jgi:hypothetical protein